MQTLGCLLPRPKNFNHYCHWLNYRKVLSLEGKMEVPLMEELLQYIEENKEGLPHVVVIYYQIALTLLKEKCRQALQRIETFVRKTQSFVQCRRSLGNVWLCLELLHSETQ